MTVFPVKVGLPLKFDGLRLVYLCCNKFYIKPIRFRSTHFEDNLQHLNLNDQELNRDTKLKIENYWKNKLDYEEFIPEKVESKFYVLSMFPYPSGNLHMGHIRVYSISDTLARFFRMNGKNVLHPMGWDAFGLPAENAAIERNMSSATWTANNIFSMRQQLKKLGCTFDWSREIATCNEDYYKFTQMLFLKMYEKGLVYQKKALVNWDPVDKTVLADEQVDHGGCSWRSGVKVEKKILKQWFIRTTAFAKDLYEGLNHKDLEDWKDIIDIQKDWIGDCNGVSFEFPLKDREGFLTLWVEKPEYLAKAKFISVPPGSVLDIESEGSGNRKLDVCLINTLTEELLPVFVTDQLPFYEGADGRVGIPEVYECDSLFASQAGLYTNESSVKPSQTYSIKSESIIEKIKGRITSSKIKDWLISRQRHWGTPIPVVHCEKCGVKPIPVKDLPVKLPQIDIVSTKGSQLVCTEEWISTRCPKCGGPARRDLDTMDTFVDSSWYYLRYIDPHNQKEPFNKDVAGKIMPVDIYIGGKEHALLHLYYARFMSYFLHSLGWLSTPEPFKRLVVQGMVLGKTYSVKNSGKYIPASEVEFKEMEVIEKATGLPVEMSWEKMSKSKNNGVDPEEMFQEYGIDTTRLLINSSVAPFSQRKWDDSTFPGVLNWQRKLWMTVKEFCRARSQFQNIQVPSDLSKVESDLRDSRNYYLQGITTGYRVTHMLNIVIAKMQGLTGDLRRYGVEYQAHSEEYARALAMQFVTLSPLAPHFAAQLWSMLQTVPGLHIQEFDLNKPAHNQAWPEVDGDHSLQLSCSVNSAIKDNIKICRAELDELTTVTATQLAHTSLRVRLYTDQSPVLETDFKLFPGLSAAIDFKIDHTKLNFSPEYYKEKKRAKKKSHR